MAKENDERIRNIDDNRVWEDIRQKAQNLKYGSIMIAIQDGSIVQVETSSKTRYK